MVPPHQTRQHEQYTDDTRLADAVDVERMHSATACATFEDFLRSTSTLGSSDKANHSVESMSDHSDEGHATFVSDSPPVGDTGRVDVSTDKNHDFDAH